MFSYHCQGMLWPRDPYSWVCMASSQFHLMIEFLHLLHRLLLLEPVVVSVQEVVELPVFEAAVAVVESEESPLVVAVVAVVAAAVVEFEKHHQHAV